MKTEQRVIEDPYYDEKGVLIKEFAVLKFFHFIGSRRKKHFMYKWVRVVESYGVRYYQAKHLTDDSGDGCFLKSLADSSRKIQGCEIVQQY